MASAVDEFRAKVLSDPDLGGAEALKLYELEERVARAGPHELGDEDEAVGGELPELEKLLPRRPDANLFDYQREVAEQVLDLFSSSKPVSGLLALPTGAGKTRTASYCVFRLLAEGTRRVLWLAPTRELLDQAFSTFKRLWQEMPLGVAVDLVRCHVAKRFPQGERVVYFATPQMAFSRLGSKRLPEVDGVVFDEAHFAAAKTFREVLAGAPGARWRLGLSATPGRVNEEENETLAALFGRRLFRSKLLQPNAIRELQRRGVLADLEFRRIPVQHRVEGLRLAVESTEDSPAVRKLIPDRRRFRAVCEKISELREGGRVLVFAGSVAHARALYASLSAKWGIRAAVVSSATPPAERSKRVRAFELGEVRVLVNKQLLATGYDCPAVRHLVLAAPIKSPILFEQMVGRAIRGPLVGGGELSTVWQLDDNLRLNGMPASYHRYEDYEWR